MENSPATDLSTPLSSGLVNAINGLMSGTLTVRDTEAMDNFGEQEMAALDAVVATLVKKTYLTRFVDTRYQIAVENPPATKALPTMTVVCQNCQNVVNLPLPDNRWYCVVRGLRIGFVRGWENVKRVVLHVPENKYAAYGTKETARKAFLLALAANEATVIVTTDFAVAYEPLVTGDGFLYP
ncbi:hypothetical protein VNI00_015266 [Paramarasmius palmivorus]|uniref:Uncharacterized protein n=1 Tax=Paramarasmius palmivorus TaxID=297713 RepID=A0AAW0BLE7_9AGAR